MNNLGHGADLEYMANIYKKDTSKIIDFSSNINPIIIDNIEKYIIESIDKCRSYPDIYYTNLRKNISKYININPEFIIPGNGATEIIYLLMKSIKNRIAILNPTFSEYERSARLNNLEVINLNLMKDNDFDIDLGDIVEKIDKFDSLFICNPNNPNGKVKNLECLLDIIIKHNKLLIVDETFMEFVEDEAKYSLIKYIDKYENIFILKAVTKFFGLPGLRLGYGITSNKEIIKNIYKYKEPWTINSFAENLSNYIFFDKEYLKKSKSYYIKERDYMLKELKKIDKLYAYDTDTNFILIKLKGLKSYKLKEKLFKEADILIRDASNFIGLDDSFIRVAIKSHKENEIFINELKKALNY